MTQRLSYAPLLKRRQENLIFKDKVDFLVLHFNTNITATMKMATIISTVLNGNTSIDHECLSIIQSTLAPRMQAKQVSVTPLSFFPPSMVSVLFISWGSTSNRRRQVACLQHCNVCTWWMVSDCLSASTPWFWSILLGLWYQGGTFWWNSCWFSPGNETPLRHWKPSLAMGKTLLLLLSLQIANPGPKNCLIWSKLRF